MKVNPKCHPGVFGRESAQLKPGDHYASYSKICTTCGARHGKPGTWLQLERCGKCLKVKLERNRTDGAVKKSPKAKNPREPIDPIRFWQKESAKVS
jgi:hypothetical protein